MSEATITLSTENLSNKEYEELSKMCSKYNKNSKKTNMENSNNRFKFRAWDKKDKKMYHNIQKGIEFSDLSHYQFDEFLGNSRGIVGYHEWEVMQFTGLKDKNGKEIYEKDITEEGTYTDWCAKCIGYQQFGIAEEGSFCHSCDGNYSLTDLVSELEVIGNIYENENLIQ